MSAKVKYDFLGSCVLVVGGNSGIGQATAIAFARAGAKVAIGDLTRFANTGVEGRLLAAGAADALFQPVDVAQEDDVRLAVDAVAARFGRIDVAVNNAGIEGQYASLDCLSQEDFDRLMTVNLRGTWLGMKYQIRHMVQRGGGGAIINTTSTAGARALPSVGAYSATKHGIIGLTRAAALEQAANGIRINGVAPGPVDTELLERMVGGHIPIADIARRVPLQRISQPDEIASVFLWLASDSASFVTGEIVVVDGGMTIA